MFDKAMKPCICGAPLVAWVDNNQYLLMVIHGDDAEHGLQIDLLYSEEFRIQAVANWLGGYHEDGRGNAHNADSRDLAPSPAPTYRFTGETSTTNTEQENNRG